MIEELESIIKELDNLKKVQFDFNDYQNAFFKAKPAEFFCLELNGEAGELANLEKKVWKGNKIDKELLEDEAADVFISLMNYSNARRINLAEAVKKKLRKIEEKRSSLAKMGEIY